MEIIDLSQTIETGMPLFSQEAFQPRIRPWQSHADSAKGGNYKDCSCEISEVHFITSISTYLDSPYHFDPTGGSIETITLDQVVLPGVVVDCTNAMGREPILPNVLDGIDIAGKAVLFHTGWSKYWGQMAYKDFPFLSGLTAERVKDEGGALIGVDFLVADDTSDPSRPVHNTLLKNNILIVENLTNLDDLPQTNFIFHAAPVKFCGAASFPVRAYGIVS